ARMPDLEDFARQHDLRILTIADLISYRLQTERLVRVEGEAEIQMDRTGTPWRSLVYVSTVDERQILALVKGDITGDAPVLCRMHAGSTMGDVFSSTRSEGRRNLLLSIDAIEAEGRGVIVYLPPRGNLSSELAKWQERKVEAEEDPHNRPHGGTLREYGLGAQVLRDLGLRRVRLLTNSKRKIAGVEGFGLEVESVALEAEGAVPKATSA